MCPIRSGEKKMSHSRACKKRQAKVLHHVASTNINCNKCNYTMVTIPTKYQPVQHPLKPTPAFSSHFPPVFQKALHAVPWWTWTTRRYPLHHHPDPCLPWALRLSCKNISSWASRFWWKKYRMSHGSTTRIHAMYIIYLYILYIIAFICVCAPGSFHKPRHAQNSITSIYASIELECGCRESTKPKPSKPSETRRRQARYEPPSC